MESQEPLQDGRQEKQAGGFPDPGVEFERDVDASAEAAGSRAGYTRGSGRRTHAGQAGDEGAGLGRIAQVVKLQHLAQTVGCGRTADDRKVAERQMRNQSPVSMFTQRRPQRGVGAVKQVTLRTALTPSVRCSCGCPPPKGSSPGRSRFVHNASTDNTVSAG